MTTQLDLPLVEEKKEPGFYVIAWKGHKFSVPREVWEDHEVRKKRYPRYTQVGVMK